MALLDRIRPSRLSAREQRLLTLLGGVLAFFVLVVAPIVLETTIFSRKSQNDKLRSALEAVQSARPQVRERQARKDAVAVRYRKKAPALAGFLEQAARSQKLEVTDSQDRPEVPIGKRYTERNTVIHLKKAGMYAIAKFIENLEKSGDAVAVTRLNVRRRTGEPDSYDVEIGVSAYDRSEQPRATDKDKEKK